MNKTSPISIKLFFVSLVTLALSLVFNLILPDILSNHPKGFETPLLAFQLAEKSSDLDFLRANTTMISSLWWLHLVDMFFPIAYSSLFVLEALRLRKVGVWLTKTAKYIWVIVAFDWIENFLMLAILASLEDVSQVDKILIYLHVFTILKWSTIALTCFMLSLAWFISKSYISAIAASGVWIFWSTSLFLSKSAFWSENMLRALGTLLAIRILYNIFAFTRNHLKSLANKP